MKKKIFFAIATSLFVVAAVFNMNILEQSNAGAFYLDAIAVMTQAQAEETGDFSAERKYVSGTSSDDCQKSDGTLGKRDFRYWGYICLGTGNLACTESINFQYTSGCY